MLKNTWTSGEFYDEIAINNVATAINDHETALSSLGTDTVRESDTSTAGWGFVVDEDDMASNLATKLPTQQSVKAYVIAKIAELISTAPVELDTWLELVAAIQADQSGIAGLTSTLATKAPINSPTFTGTVNGVTKAMVGLGSADNTSDVNKPVSTAQAAADAATLTSATGRAVAFSIAGLG